MTTEDGGSDFFTISLCPMPTAAVSIDISTSDSSEGLLFFGAAQSLITVVLTDLNWDTGVQVQVVGQDDPFLDGDIAYTLFTDAAISGDAAFAAFAGFDAPDISAVNLDTNVPAPATLTLLGCGALAAGRRRR